MNPSQRAMNELATYFGNGNMTEVIRRGRKLLHQYPKSHQLANIVGTAFLRSDNPKSALPYFKKAVSISPKHASYHLNTAIALLNSGHIQRSKASVEKALNLDPGYAKAILTKGNLCREEKDNIRAIDLYKKALEIDPTLADAHNNLGVSLREEGDIRASIMSFETALKLNPKFAYAAFCLGFAYLELGDREKSFKFYQLASRLDPHDTKAILNIGIALLRANDLSNAANYFRKVIQIDKKSVAAHVNLGAVYHRQKRIDDAISSYKDAIKIDPEFAESYFCLGEALIEYRDFEAAVHNIDKGLSIDPANTAAKMQKFSALLKMCDWDSMNDDLDGRSALDVYGDELPLLTNYYLIDDPQLQYARACAWGQKEFPAPASFDNTSTRSPKENIRIGYVSANFQEHPVMDLMTGYFREYDRDGFDVHAIGNGPPIDPNVRAFLVKQGVTVHDLSAASDADFVEKVHGLDLDIAIDMTGHTNASKTHLFSQNLARVQVNFLAYPGTLGADFFDYIVADKTVIPPAQTDNYSESIIWLPDSFMPCDNQRLFANEQKTRSEYGLPEDGFVFCSFNNPVKITSQEFDIWMRLLARVDKSCLWLTGKNEWVAPNLREQAIKRGIDPGRIVFADRVEMSEHLARHVHADLFLDTFNYNAHTTANEALWAGLPVLTKIGKQFSARVAASQLHAVGLSELVTNGEYEYEQLALQLAETPSRLSELRLKLRERRLTSPLFDTKRYVKNLENCFREAHRRAGAGEPSSNIDTAIAATDC